MIRDSSAAALTASHYSILDHKLRRGQGVGFENSGRHLLKLWLSFF